VASLSSQVLHDTNVSAIQKNLAGRALTQRMPSKQTGAYLEDVASKALSSSKYNAVTKCLSTNKIIILDKSS